MPALSSAPRSTWTGAIRRLSLALALVLIVAAIAGLARPVSTAAATDVTWQRYDVDLDVRDDGSYHVTETQVINFQGGTYSYGFATIPLDRIDAIDNIAMTEERDGQTIAYRYVPWSQFDREPETYTYRQSNAEIEIDWGFPATRNDSRTFLLEYDVIGAMRVYSNGTDTRQQIWWTAISSDVTDVGDVDESTVTIRLPKAVDPATALLGENAEQKPQDHTTDGQVWTWTERNLRSGDDFIVRLEVPEVAPGAAPPSWQAGDDQQRLEEQKRSDRQALYNVVFLGIGLLFAVLGGAGLYGLWYMRGRDPHVGMVADFLPEPPDDLPPGAAGALIDEEVHERDIVSTIVDLGRRGIIKIDEQTQEGVLGIGGSRDFSLTLLQGNPSVTQFERTLLSSFFGPSLKEGTTERLSRVKGAFNQQRETIKEQIYDELVKRGYFTASPEQTRQRWRRGAIVALVGIIILACVGGGFLASLSPFVLLPITVAATVALLLIFLSRALPKKTLAGAEAAAKWRAFRKYLDDIEKYEKVDESRQIFDKYLPYAVAFGLEESWVRKFASVGAEAPAWFGPVVVGGPQPWSGGPYGRRGSRRGGTWIFPSGGGWSAGSGSRGGGGGGGFDMPNLPDLQDMSDSAGKKIQGSSNSLFDMLTAAARAFEDISGSGGGGGRHWGGGGGGFRGGGSRGGSSGGGRRGFG